MHYLYNNWNDVCSNSLIVWFFDFGFAKNLNSCQPKFFPKVESPLLCFQTTFEVFLVTHRCKGSSKKTGTFCRLFNIQKQSCRGVLRERCSENIKQIFWRTSMPKCDFSKVAKQLYWNHTSAWAFSCKFAVYFQNTSSKEHLWMAASEYWDYRRTCSISQTTHVVLDRISWITHFSPKFHFYTPWKRQKTFGSLMFAGSIEMEHCARMA